MNRNLFRSIFFDNKIFNYFKIAFVAVRNNKSRSTLTMLEIAIGIAAVIALISIGKGAETLIANQIVLTGSKNIFIEPGSGSEKPGEELGLGSQGLSSWIEYFEVKTLKYEDALAIKKISTIEGAAPFIMKVDQVVYGDVKKKIVYLGTTVDAFEVVNIKPILGRLLNDQDVNSMARVVILGYKIKKDLFGEEDPIGKIIRIQKTNFTVIAVAEEKGIQSFMDLDNNVFLPVTTAQKLLAGSDALKWIVARAKSNELMDEAVHEIRLLLRARHNINNPEGDLSKDDFKVITQLETTVLLNTVLKIFAVFLMCVASIALVVGGIGVMNIMLVSVTERTKEIGLRKAVGAKKEDILIQFLLESLILSASGGLVGIVGGVTLSIIGTEIFRYFGWQNWGSTVVFESLILALGISTIVGLVFGIYPALRAARMDPIEALRYE